jgi:hypothetical protein
MIAAAVAIAAVAVALLRGGSLRKLAATRFVGLFFLMASIAAQLALVLFRIPGQSGLHRLALIAPPLLIGYFCLANRSLPGMWFIVAGVVLNTVVIGANGRMPLSSWAREHSGATLNTSLSSGTDYYEPAGPDTVLPMLGDVIPIAGVHQVASPGDLLLAVGVERFLYCRAMATSHPGALASTDRSESTTRPKRRRRPQ